MDRNRRNLGGTARYAEHVRRDGTYLGAGVRGAQVTYRDPLEAAYERIRALAGCATVKWALVALFFSSSPARAATWVLGPDCTLADQTRLANQVIPYAEAALRGTSVYVDRMTGAYNDSYNYLYWFAAWTKPFYEIVRTDVDKVEADLRAYAIHIACHDQSSTCDGTNAAWAEFTFPAVYLCDIAWVHSDDAFASFLIHEISHFSLGTDDYGMRGPGDARLLVLSGTLADPSPWWLTVTGSYNWQFFVGSNFRGGCSSAPAAPGGHPRAGLLLVFVAALLVRRWRYRMIALYSWVFGAAFLVGLFSAPAAGWLS